MYLSEIARLLDKIYHARVPARDDLRALLSLNDPSQEQVIFDFADIIRKACLGDGILLRGIVEFSNYCRNSCAYCGLHKQNTELIRYRLSAREVLDSVGHLASCNIKTVVLQSGEEDDLDPEWLKMIIEQVKLRHDIAITLSVGERSRSDYALWKKAGADRYLLKIETSNKALYESLHPNMSFENRVRCLQDLKELGYQTGSGSIVGLKGQQVDDRAGDIIFFKEQGFEMIGIGPFIPHKKTALADESAGNVRDTLKVLALTRIVTKEAHLPATTALGSLGDDFRTWGLRSGANVLMPNFTPQPYRRLYEIYPGKRCIDEPAGACSSCMEVMAQSIGRTIDYSRGDGFMRREGIYDGKNA